VRQPHAGAQFAEASAQRQLGPHLQSLQVQVVLQRFLASMKLIMVGLLLG
jgi:hypothetical protein